MNRKSLIIFAFLFLLIGLITTGCEKEKIVESTEYIHDIEYVNTPADTIFKIDTVFKSDTTTTTTTVIDTVIILDSSTVSDTIFINDTTIMTITDSIAVFDTVTQIINNYDTVIIADTINTIEYNYDTLIVADTINTVEYIHDTISVTDTVQVSQNIPNEFLAFTALQYYSDPMVIEATTAEYGITGGYIFYLSAYQHSMTKQSTSVYDIYGYIDFWTTDWSDFYAYEYYWRMTYIGGDPADPLNWQISDPPAFNSSNTPGLNVIQKNEDANLLK